MRMSKAEKLIESQVSALFNQLGSGIQFNIMDLQYISKAARNVLVAGGSLELAAEAMSGAIEVYRVN